jgi:hypothetical protein
LTVTDGVQVATLTLIGSYVSSNFVLSNDDDGGTTVVDPPITALGAAAHVTGPFVQAMAVMGAGHGLSYEGSGLQQVGGAFGGFTSGVIPAGLASS